MPVFDPEAIARQYTEVYPVPVRPALDQLKFRSENISHFSGVLYLNSIIEHEADPQRACMLTVSLEDAAQSVVLSHEALIAFRDALTEAIDYHTQAAEREQAFNQSMNEFHAARDAWETQYRAGLDEHMARALAEHKQECAVIDKARGL